jgi:hypothetical protein
MQNQSTSARTAAQKSSKSSLIQRPAIILATLLLCAVFCQGQDTTKTFKRLTDTSAASLTGIITFGDSLLTISGSSWGNTFNYGYNKTGKLDTVKAVLLITDCDNCQSKSITAFAVREQSAYFGDRMPPGNYDDYWSVKSYLDNKKKPFPSAITIWDCRLK